MKKIIFLSSVFFVFPIEVMGGRPNDFSKRSYRLARSLGSAVPPPPAAPVILARPAESQRSDVKAKIRIIEEVIINSGFLSNQSFDRLFFQKFLEMALEGVNDISSERNYNFCRDLCQNFSEFYSDNQRKDPETMHILDPLIQRVFPLLYGFYIDEGNVTYITEPQPQQRKSRDVQDILVRWAQNLSLHEKTSALKNLNTKFLRKKI